MEKHFAGFTLKHIPRNENSEADELAKAAAQNSSLPADVFFQNLTAKAIKEEEEKPQTVHTILSEDWRAPIFASLSGADEPLDKKEIERMNSRTRHYKIIAGDLFKSGITEPWLKCISRQEGQQLLSEIHTGACGAHRGPHEIAHRALRQGFYWPTTAEDAKQLVKTYESCKCSRKT